MLGTNRVTFASLSLICCQFLMGRKLHVNISTPKKEGYGKLEN